MMIPMSFDVLDDNFPFVTYYLNKYLPSVAYDNYNLTCSDLSYAYRTGQSNTLAAMRVSRERRGVPEQQEDEDLLNLNAEYDEEIEGGGLVQSYAAWFAYPNLRVEKYGHFVGQMASPSTTITHCQNCSHTIW
jgi:hypothetical protein